jgi:acyl-CoA thioesterase-1
MPALPSRGTVVFLGDSITWHNHFLVFIESHLRRVHPGRELRLVNRGARGETVPRALVRLEQVVALRPALVVVWLGMNDGGYRGLDRPRLARFRDGIDRLVTRLRRRTSAHLVLVTPTAVAPPDARYNRMLAAMTETLEELGRSRGVAVIDLFRPFRRLLARAPGELMADATHPGPAGHLLLADLLLRQLDPACPGANPGVVRVDLSASASAPSTTVTVVGRGVFVPEAARPALRLLPAARRRLLLGEQRLVVTGAKGDDTIELAARGRSLGTFGAAQLARGVELGSLAGAPWVEEAVQLHRLLQLGQSSAELPATASHQLTCTKRPALPPIR